MMKKVTINPELIRLSYAEFVKWCKATLPNEDPDKLYIAIGGKVPKNKGE
jgi:hypothetical protein